MVFTAKSPTSVPQTTRSADRNSAFLNTAILVVSILTLCCAIFVCFRALFLIVTTCSNALGTDYVHAVSFIDTALTKGLDPSIPFAHDIHSLVLPRMMHLMNAKFFAWDARVELLICFGLLLLRTYLTFACLTLKSSRSAQLTLLALVFLLNFGTCNASILFCGQPATSFGLCGFFFVLGLWGWAALRPNAALALLAAAGTLSCYCVANWPACWLAYFVIVVLSKTEFRRAAVAASITVLLSLPVVLSMLTQKVGTNDGVDRSNILAIADSFINTIGRPFCNDIAVKFSSLPMSALAGGEALVFCVLLVALSRKRLLHNKQTQCAVALIVYGLGSSLITSLSRAYITPWYVTFGCYLWTGLGALAIFLIDETGFAMRLRSKGLSRRIGAVIGCLFVCTFGFNYVRTNISYKDKDWYRRTHSPSSEMCLREYRTIPTYGEQCIFAGEVGDLERLARLAVPLEKHELSAFSRSFERSLQGDYILPSVVTHEAIGSSEIQWVDPIAPRKKLSWQDPEHLSLKIYAGNVVTWDLSLPADTSSAVFHTELRGISPKTGEMPKAVVKISSGEISQHAEVLPVSNSFRDFSVPLSSKERGVSISLGALGAADGYILFQYPVVRIERTGSPRALQIDSNLRPANTELSKSFPAYTKQDLVFPPNDSAIWAYDDIEVIESGGGIIGGTFLSLRTAGTKPTLTLKTGLNVSAQEYSHLCFGLEGSESLSKPRVSALELVINGTVLRKVLVPLLWDSGMHSYSYDLKLLELGKDERITGLCFLPVYMRSEAEKAIIRINDIRFVKKDSKARPVLDVNN